MVTRFTEVTPSSHGVVFTDTVSRSLKKFSAAYHDLRCLLVYVVVQFYPWSTFYFPLFWGKVMYDNEFETLRKIKFQPKIKLLTTSYIKVTIFTPWEAMFNALRILRVRFF